MSIYIIVLPEVRTFLLLQERSGKFEYYLMCPSACTLMENNRLKHLGVTDSTISQPMLTVKDGENLYKGKNSE